MTSDGAPERNTMLDAALSWFKFGLLVIPLDAEKRTVVAWHPWLTDLDEDKILGHWRAHPQHQVGAIMTPDLFVADADHSGAIAALERIEAEHGLACNQVHSTQKGFHHLFRRAQGTMAKNAACSTKGHPAGIDIRTARSGGTGKGNGQGMLVLPPSGGREVVRGVDSIADLVEVDQAFIDAVVAHNNATKPPSKRVHSPGRQLNNGGQQLETDDPEVIEARVTLEYLDPTCAYEDWLKIGMSLHSKFEGAKIGLQLWDQWSGAGDNYPGTGLLEYKWDTFIAGNGITFGTLVHMAREAGWGAAESTAAEDFGNLAESIPSPQKVEPWPAHLLRPPGLVGEIADYVLRSSHKPQPPLAVMAGLVGLSALTCNGYVVDRWYTHLNLYAVAVLPTGGGKDRPAKVAQDVAGIGGMTLIVNDCASGAALVRAMAGGRRSVFLWKDEIWQMIESINSKHGQSHQKELGAILMSLYSAAGSTYHGKVYANRRDNIDPIERPYVVFTGATTPQRFIAALSDTQVVDGLLNRLLVFSSDDVPESVVPALREMPGDLMGALRAVIEKLPAVDAAMDFGEWWKCTVQVKVDPTAVALLDAFGRRCDAEVRKQDDLSPLWSRGLENAVKVAGILAVGVDHQAPTIDEAAAHWAIDLVTHCLTSLGVSLDKEMASSDFDRNCKKALNYIREARNYAGDAKFAQWCKAGKMPRGKLTKLMRLEPKALDQVVHFLCQSGEIAVGSETLRGKQTTVYWVLT